jgi:hypothetical protein
MYSSRLMHLQQTALLAALRATSSTERVRRATPGIAAVLGNARTDRTVAADVPRGTGADLVAKLP